MTNKDITETVISQLILALIGDESIVEQRNSCETT